MSTHRARRFVAAAAVVAALSLSGAAPSSGSSLGIEAVEALITARKIDEARRRFDSLPAEAKSAPRGLFLDAVISHHIGDFVRSLELLQSSLEAEPRNAAALKLFGLNAVRLGRPELAAEHLRAATVLAPGDAQAWLYFGVNQLELKRTAAALEALREAVRIRPDWIEARCALGLALEQSGEFGKAEAIYAEAAADQDRLQSGPSTPYLYLGRLLLARRRNAAAVEMLEKAVRVNPDGPEEWHQYGRALEESQRHQDALRALSRAVSLDPSSARPHYQRMRALKALGREQEAREAAEQFRKLNHATASPPDPR